MQRRHDYRAGEPRSEFRRRDQLQERPGLLNSQMMVMDGSDGSPGKLLFAFDMTITVIVGGQTMTADIRVGQGELGVVFFATGGSQAPSAPFQSKLWRARRRPQARRCASHTVTTIMLTTITTIITSLARARQRQRQRQRHRQRQRQQQQHRAGRQRPAQRHKSRAPWLLALPAGASLLPSARQEHRRDGQAVSVRARPRPCCRPATSSWG